MTGYAMEFVKECQVEGDYLEFGLYAGRGFSSAYHFAKFYGLKNMKFYGFDSFEGLPEIRGKDKNDFIHYHKGEYVYGLKKFIKKMKKEGLDFNSGRVTLIPGWYNKTLTKTTKDKLSIKKAAVVLVDCDLYESTVPVLDFITDYIQDGTILIFDDWFAFRGDPDKGEQRAFKEWLRKNPKFKAIEYYRHQWGMSFIMMVKGKR